MGSASQFFEVVLNLDSITTVDDKVLRFSIARDLGNQVDPHIFVLIATLMAYLPCL